LGEEKAGRGTILSFIFETLSLVGVLDNLAGESVRFFWGVSIGISPSTVI
jgi:hypothetical protein